MPEGILEAVADRVYRIEDRFVNLYLLDLGRVALVDTGTRRAEHLLRQGLRQLGKDPEDIAFVLLTHHHVDHVGTAGIWQREAKATVALHEADAAVVAGQERRRGQGVGLRGRVLVAFAGLFTRRLAVPPLQADRTFPGPTSFDLPGAPVEVIPAPGHTLGSCAFHLPPEGVLFAGDAVNGRRGRAEPPIFVEDAAAARVSYHRLLSMDVRILCPGHGRPIRRR